MSEIALITSADPWSMKDENTGKLLSGNTVFFYTQYREDSDDGYGLKPTKISCSPEMIDDLKGKVPGYFELHLGVRPGAQGKAALTLVGVTFIKKADLFAGVNQPQQQASKA